MIAPKKTSEYAPNAALARLRNMGGKAVSSGIIAIIAG